jgi:hypothetical protein
VGKSNIFQIQGTAAIDSRRDLALLKVSGTTSSTLSLATSANVAVGDDVYALGNPQGFEGTVSHGIVSGIRTVGTDRLIQISAPISPGSSGGPVLSADGKLVGVAVGSFTGGQNLNFCVPAIYLGDLLATRGDTIPLTNQGRAGQSRPTTLLRDLVPRPGDAIQVTHFDLTDTSFEFIAHNRLDVAITNVRFLFVFRDEDNEVVDYSDVTCRRAIPPGLATACRGQISLVASRAIAFWQVMSWADPSSRPKFQDWYEVRVLGWDLVE